MFLIYVHELQQSLQLAWYGPNEYSFLFLNTTKLDVDHTVIRGLGNLVMKITWQYGKLKDIEMIPDGRHFNDAGFTSRRLKFLIGMNVDDVPSVWKNEWTSTTKVLRTVYYMYKNVVLSIKTRKKTVLYECLEVCMQHIS